ncbi:glycosyltransferase family 1 protein [Paenibacillus aceris]|uniref:Glycosyltransferase EpsF n=1 Tax=Paenibacillus aceris TaxID=869555 RepID=A0ABS4I887_9BACL|nr:glycosyltransferase family 1 protein [Paenibacillus aceris]MBP1967058.1 glycosyltransferase EpsF [Paenibacillus aceris]NHW33255.1 glycosyltransferase family 1 protein [Paenibacillus aceris]
MKSNTFPNKVLHVVSAMNRGGAETLLMNIYRNVDHSKIQFDFVSHLPEKCDYDDEIVSLGGQVYRIPSLGKLGPIHYVKQLQKLISDNGPYLAVHAHTDFQSGIVTLAAKQAGIRKRICHSHNNDWTLGKGVKARVSLEILKLLIRAFGTDYCACSEDAARFLFNGGTIKKGKVSMLKNGIEVSRYSELNNDCQSSLKRELAIPPESKVIGHIGRFYEQKNHVFLLSIFKKMANNGHDFVAVLVGDGPLKYDIENEAARLGISHYIRFVGVRSDIPRLMRSFDAFVFPSLFEGFGIVMIEAQAAGTPCIAADVVPIETDMGLGLVSYVSLKESSDQWISEIQKALSMKRPGNKIIVNKISEKGFDIKTNISEWMSLYGV